MIVHNPENAKIVNEYQYNLLHTGALYGNKDIVALAIEKVRCNKSLRRQASVPSREIQSLVWDLAMSAQNVSMSNYQEDKFL